MEDKLKEAIRNFIQAYEKSSFKKREDELDMMIADDDTLTALKREVEANLGQNDATSIKKIASDKKKFYENDKVKERFELQKKAKNLLKPIEDAIRNLPTDPYSGY